MSHSLYTNIIGKHHTKKTKDKIRVAFTGDKNPNFGKGYYGKDNPNYGKGLFGRDNPMYGKHHSKVAIRKMSISQKLRHKQEALNENSIK